MGILFLEGVGAIAIGLVLGYAALHLLGEYRRAFFANPRAVMTLEVLFKIAELGGPGYVAMFGILGALGLISGGIVLVILFFYETLRRMGWL